MPAEKPAPDLLRSSGHVNDVLHPGRLLTSEMRISTTRATRKRQIMELAAQFKTSPLTLRDCDRTPKTGLSHDARTAIL